MNSKWILGSVEEMACQSPGEEAGSARNLLALYDQLKWNTGEAAHVDHKQSSPHGPGEKVEKEGV